MLQWLPERKALRCQAASQKEAENVARVLEYRLRKLGLAADYQVLRRGSQVFVVRPRDPRSAPPGAPDKLDEGGIDKASRPG
jgi:hypothetical protein